MSRCGASANSLRLRSAPLFLPALCPARLSTGDEDVGTAAGASATGHAPQPHAGGAARESRGNPKSAAAMTRQRGNLYLGGLVSHQAAGSSWTLASRCRVLSFAGFPGPRPHPGPRWIADAEAASRMRAVELDLLASNAYGRICCVCHFGVFSGFYVAVYAVTDQAYRSSSSTGGPRGAPDLRRAGRLPRRPAPRGVRRHRRGRGCATSRLGGPPSPGEQVVEEFPRAASRAGDWKAPVVPVTGGRRPSGSWPGLAGGRGAVGAGPPRLSTIVPGARSRSHRGPRRRRARPSPPWRLTINLRMVLYSASSPLPRQRAAPPPASGSPTC